MKPLEIPDIHIRGCVGGHAPSVSVLCRVGSAWGGGEGGQPMVKRGTTVCAVA